ncbi:NUDIX hydrolase [Lysinibacter cavernae]|uniref:8-oxo-dGTP diphosphatase n=1 Tax=Lysinibacter cavernae TaxID=1640652 RepID=A0A7X5R2S4_9MICO|nr:NUDIX domain-containing protein [Lysinibacter cavernae]NIH54362.1 8-oxo-dGTP diphosphatase [Lysinibacter cavernae]
MDYAAANVSERRFLPPRVAVSTVAFALRPPAEGANPHPSESEPHNITLWLPLVRRTRDPFRGQWALPGGPLTWNESLSDTSRRTLADTTGASPRYLEQLYAFGEPERSASDQRLVTIAYWALLTNDEIAGDTGVQTVSEPAAAQRSSGQLGNGQLSNVAWFSADSLPDLAFDHADIVNYALWRLRNKTEYSTVAYRFLGESFTLAQLRVVYEAVLGKQSDPANFRRQALASGHLRETGRVETGVGYRPAKLYSFSDVDHAASDTRRSS